MATCHKMKLTSLISELIGKFSKNRQGKYNRFLGSFWIIILPVVGSVASLLTIGPESVFNSDFSQVFISIISIFAAFYISLLVYINQKTNEIISTPDDDQTRMSNSLRTVNNSRKLTIYLLYSLICIIISITLILIANLNFSTPNVCLNKNITYIGGFIEFFTLISFIILLFKIVRNSQTDFIKDLKDKEEEISTKMKKP